MSRTRTPPPFQPQGWEKSDKHVDIQCTESERLLWKLVWGSGKSADGIRKVLNQTAYELSGVTQRKQATEKIKVSEAVKLELNRHAAEMRRLALMKK